MSIMRELVILTALCFVGATLFLMLGRILADVAPIVIRWLS